MDSIEFRRLMGFWKAKIGRPTMPLGAAGKRMVRNKANGTGSVLKNSFIKPQTSIEKSNLPFSKSVEVRYSK